VSGPLAKTFAVLTASSSLEASELLLAALDSCYEAICLPAALALTERNGLHGQREVLSRFPRLPSAVQQALQNRSEQFDGCLRQMLLHGDATQCREGMNGVRWLRSVNQIPQLIELMCRAHFPHLESAEQCLRDLVTLLEDDLRSTSVADAGRTIVMSRRDRALLLLEQALGRYDQLVVKEPLIESILILGPPQHAAVKKVLWTGPLDCRERAGRLLLSSRHPKIMRQALESLKQTYPHPKAFEAVRTRTDVEFLCELFRFCSVKVSGTLAQNLRQIERVEWLEADEAPFPLIPQSLQPALLSFVFHTKVPTEQKARTQDWLLRNGGPEGRMAAAEQAALIDENVLQSVLVDSLDAEDEHVQAWAVTQLRQHAVPEAIALLIQRLDSPSAEVRAAARDELSGFNLELVLGLLDSLDAATARHVGELLRKIDLQVCAKLQRDLLSGIRPKRMRAAQAVVKLGYHRQLLQPLLSLAKDGDALLRRGIAELLGSLAEPEVLPVLESLANDPHPRVREAAAHSLIAWQKQAAQRLDPLLTS
jgi:hypothetical protein